jgi:hypothetical protein
MPKFNFLIGHDVPHYGYVEIVASDPEHALETLKAKPLHEILDNAVTDPAWDSSICARIVNMQDEEGESFFEDTALDNTYAEWSAVTDLTSALREAEAYLSGADTRTTPAQLVDRINAALAMAGAA